MKISINKALINQLCQKHSVEKLYLFGSATNDNFTPESDLDFLVKFQSINLSTYFTNYLSLKEQLKDLFKREIDLVEEQSLKNPILIQSINNSKQLIYG